MNGEFAKCGCRHCGTHLEFPITGAGLTINCPHCNEPTLLALSEREVAPSPENACKPSAVELVSAFGGPVPRTRVSFFYQLGLVLVSVLMVLLPLAYVAMVLAAGWGVYTAAA
jgi:hypothetical protein